MQHFSKLFKKDQEIRETIVSFFTYPTYLEDNHICLHAVPSKLESKKTLFDMNLHKALGEDGFPTIFYQHCWNTVGPTLYNHLLRFG